MGYIPRSSDLDPIPYTDEDCNADTQAYAPYRPDAVMVETDLNTDLPLTESVAELVAHFDSTPYILRWLAYFRGSTRRIRRAGRPY